MKFAAAAVTPLRRSPRVAVDTHRGSTHNQPTGLGKSRGVKRMRDADKAYVPEAVEEDDNVDDDSDFQDYDDKVSFHDHVLNFIYASMKTLSFF